MTRLPTLSAFPITPCEPDGRIDRAALRRLLEPLAAAKVGSERRRDLCRKESQRQD